jgi:hypothetical protein
MSYLVDHFTKRKVFTVLKNPLKWVAGFGRWVGWKAFCHQWKLTKHQTTQEGTTTKYFPQQI